MNKRQERLRIRAFTVLELLVVVAGVLVLSGLLLPMFLQAQRPWGCTLRANCVNNLKQVGLAARLWSGDNNDKYPMAYAGNPSYPLINNGSDWSAVGATAQYQFTVFSSMSNELSTPKIVVCPNDKRSMATNFTTDFNNNHISYFVGLDADETKPNVLLAGDRNLTNGQLVSNGILYLQTNQNVGWNRELHNQCGNVAMADGHVEQITNKILKTLLAKPAWPQTGYCCRNERDGAYEHKKRKKCFHQDGHAYRVGSTLHVGSGHFAISFRFP